jgi:serine/threonine protein kinase
MFQIQRSQSSIDYIKLDSFLKKYDLIKNKQVDHVHDEVTLISNMRHPFIVGFEGFTQDEHYIYLAMEFVQGGEFFLYIRSMRRLTPYDAG